MPKAHGSLISIYCSMKQEVNSHGRAWLVQCSCTHKDVKWWHFQLECHPESHLSVLFDGLNEVNLAKGTSNIAIMITP